MEKGKKVSELEDFARVDSSVKVIGYSKSANKFGTVPISSLTGKQPIAGCRWKIGNSSPEGEPYGDYDMIANLNTVLGLGGYLVKNDHTRQKLDPTNHFKLESGGAAALDGTMGHYQWGWGVPFYYATWKDNTYEYEAVSLQPIPNHWNYKIPVASMSCSGAAALDRTNNILVSFCNRTTQYRGGNNDATLDSAWNTMLGKPVVNIASNLYETYAEKNGPRWGASMYRIIYVVGMLMRIVFHNRSIQTAYNSALTADGLHQGGLGYGISNYNESFGGQYGVCDIDLLAEEGDALGVFSKSIDKDDGTQFTYSGIPVFFGLKNFYHYLWIMSHDMLLSYNSDKSISVYQTRIWGEDAMPTSSISNMDLIGTVPAKDDNWYFPSKVSLNRLFYLPLEFGGSESQYYGDGFRHNGITSGLRGLLALGSAHNGGFAGSCCLSGNSAPSDTYVDRGAFLCEASEDWDAVAFWEP